MSAVFLLVTELNNNNWFYFRNSYSPECLAPYGGNIEPALAFGKLANNSTDYKTASSVFLTFVVNNNIDLEKLKPAKLWEKR